MSLYGLKGLQSLSVCLTISLCVSLALCVSLSLPHPFLSQSSPEGPAGGTEPQVSRGDGGKAGALCSKDPGLGLSARFNSTSCFHALRHLTGAGRVLCSVCAHLCLVTYKTVTHMGPPVHKIMAVQLHVKSDLH